MDSFSAVATEIRFFVLEESSLDSCVDYAKVKGNLRNERGGVYVDCERKSTQTTEGACNGIASP
jgi:hypothetical protein